MTRRTKNYSLLFAAPLFIELFLWRSLGLKSSDEGTAAAAVTLTTTCLMCIISFHCLSLPPATGLVFSLSFPHRI